MCRVETGQMTGVSGGEPGRGAGWDGDEATEKESEDVFGDQGRERTERVETDRAKGARREGRPREGTRNDRSLSETRTRWGRGVGDCSRVGGERWKER